MKGWLIYDRAGAKRNESYISMHFEEAKPLGIELELKYVEDFTFGVCKGERFLLYKEKKEEKPAFVICRTIHPFFSKHLEDMGFLLFNNAKVSEICNDKAKTYAYLADKGIPMIDSVFWRNETAERELKKMPDNIVVKAVDGHGGTQVFLKQDGNAEEILKGIGTSDVVVQPLVGTSHQDVRVYVIGEEIIAAVCRTAKDGFKSNYSLGGKVELYRLKPSQEALVKKIIREFSFGLVGIDFLIDENGEFIFNEIEDVVGARMLYQCSDIPLVQKYLMHIMEQVGGK